jgi:hypothetical protein
MATKIELAKRYIELQRDHNTDEMIAMLADDVVMTTPMTGTVAGKAALEQQLRAAPAHGGGMTITWLEPEEDGENIKVIGTGTPFGNVKVLLSFNGDDKLARIEAGLA